MSKTPQTKLNILAYNKCFMMEAYVIKYDIHIHVTFPLKVIFNTVRQYTIGNILKRLYLLESLLVKMISIQNDRKYRKLLKYSVLLSPRVGVEGSMFTTHC